MAYRTSQTALACVVALGLASGPGVAQELIIYPAEGQSAEEQEKDRSECHMWAVQQSGFDPATSQAAATPSPDATPPPPEEPKEGGVPQGAARGGAVGAVAGAITGSAGRGAALGAATGGLIGGFRRHDQRQRQAAEQQAYEQQQAQAQQQQEAVAASGRDAYQRAFAACMEGRGYEVN